MGVNLGIVLPVLVSLAVLLYWLLEGFPALARDRLTRESSRLRSVLRSLEAEQSGLQDVGAYQWLDRALSDGVRLSRVMGVSHLLTGLLVVRRRRKQQNAAFAAEHDGSKQPVRDGLESLAPAELFALHALYITGSREFVRGVTLGSRLWWLAWPLYRYLDAKLRAQLASSVVDASVEDQSVRQAVGVGAQFWHHDPQTV
ncbi:MAG: hypothetical protein ACR2KO_06020 [Geodermatophilaceae bacterium]